MFASSPTPRRRRSGGVIVLTAAAFAAAACDAPKPEPAPMPSVLAPVRGDERMFAELRAAAERADEVNTFLGTGLARDARTALARLPGDAAVSARVNAELKVSYEELRLGDPAAAIRHLDAAQALVPKLEASADPNTAVEVAFRLGVAWMRLGEMSNCCRRPGPQSCILPIEGAGQHADPSGSEHASGYFRAAMGLAPKDSLFHVKSRWLLNVAAMTLGKWPEGLSESERFPRSAFDSGVAFPHFPNVASAVGAAGFNLAGGAVLDDLDGDGRIDILTSSSDVRVAMRFLRNDGRGGFEDRSKEAGLEHELGGLNLIGADYDNDGDLDVYVLRGGWFRGEAGRVPSSLLRNDGAGHFTDVTFDARLGRTSFPSPTGSWADYDGDGFLDLCVGSECDPDNDFPNQLFHNNGNGTFTDVAHDAGVENWRFCKSVDWGDYDGDGRPDIYVSNNGAPNRLYHNDGGGRFTDVAPALGVDMPNASFGAFFFDYDNDGVLDIWVSGYRGQTGEVARMAADALGVRLEDDERTWKMFYRDGKLETQRLYRGDGWGGFTDVTAQCGLVHVNAPMGHNFGDLDNDGWLDFYLGTGYPDYEGLMPNVMYRNEGGKRFADVTWAGGFGHLQKGHAIAFADIDDDGDADVFAEMGGALAGDGAFNALYRNPGFGNHWLTVHLVGRRTNRCAIGARLKADIVEDGVRRSVYRHVNSGGTFGCNPLRQTLGLGQAARVERLEVYWPTTGATQVFTDLAVDRAIRITEGSDKVEPLER